MLITRIVTVSGLLCAALIAAGCSDSHGGRMEVSRSVKLKGEPIKDDATKK